jgi:trans-aconitate 2-methyltransferase
MSSAEYYDEFISYQIKSGINDRIFQLYKRLCKLGLNSSTNVLEIGCGIGSLTFLLSRKIKKGRIEAVDISKKSINYAKSNLNRSNLSFTAGDIFEFETDFSPFDFILLFDVIEHIPEQDHIGLFQKISKWMNDQTKLLINIPNPEYLLFDRKNNPNSLQEIDQPIFIDPLANAIGQADLHIEYFETYSVWVKNDYQFLVIKKKSPFVERFLHRERNGYQRLKNRLSRDFRRLIYAYPPKHK